MKKRVIFATLIAFVLLLAVVAAGLNAVFTVTKVTPVFTVFSEEGKKDAQELEEKLNSFKGKSTTFLKLNDVKEVVEAYPCFRVDEIKKSFPNEIKVRVTERNALFAYESETGYTVLDDEGFCLFIGREDLSNRSGGDNILLRGFKICAPLGGVVEGKFFDELLEMFSVFRESFPAVRANVVSVTLKYRGADRDENYEFSVLMREGVTLRIADPLHRPAEKAACAVEKFLSLEDGQKAFGYVTVVERETGDLVAGYRAENPN